METAQHRGHVTMLWFFMLGGVELGRGMFSIGSSDELCAIAPTNVQLSSRTSQNAPASLAHGLENPNKRIGVCTDSGPFYCPKFEPKPEWLSWPLASKVRQAGPSGHLNQRSCGQWQQGTGSHWSDLVAPGILQSSWSTKYHPSLFLGK